MPLLLLKAKVRGDAGTGDLFAMPVPVAGHMRGPVYVAPHTAIRHKAPDYGQRLDQMQARREPAAIPDSLRPALLQVAQHIATSGQAPALAFTPPQLSAMRAAGWLEPAAATAYGAEIGNLTLTPAGKTAMARAVAERNEAASTTASAEGATAGALFRPTYPDGRMIPQPGDRVRRMVPGLFGMPVVLDGIVRGKTVQLTTGISNRKQDVLSPSWSVVGDPALERIAAERRAKAEAERQAAEAQRAAEAAAAEAARQQLVATRGTLEGVALTPGEVIEDPDGRLHIVAQTDEHGGAYGYALDDPDQHASGLGMLDGWRRTDAPAPPGAIIEQNRGEARRRTADGQWEDVVWSERAGGWVPSAEFGPPPPDAEVATMAADAIRIWLDGNRGKRRSEPDMEPISALEELLQRDGRELRQRDENRVIRAMDAIRRAPDFPDGFLARPAAPPAQAPAMLVRPAPPPTVAPPPEPMRWAKFHPLSDGDFAALRQAVAAAVPGARVLKMVGKPTQARIFPPKPANPDEQRFFTGDEQGAIQAALDRLGMGGPLYAHTRGEAGGISQGFFGIQRMETNLRPAPAPAPAMAAVDQLRATNTQPGDGAELAELKARFARTKPGDRLYDTYRARIEADPSKWRTGMGVTYQVAGGRGMQTNRGYRVVRVDPANKRIAVQLIRDAGYADAMPGDPPMWIWMGEARRAKADDAAELGPAAPRQAPAAGDAGTIHRAFTADYTSEIHYARDKQGQVWRRHQFRDPRYGYKWSGWKMHGKDMPAGATATDRRARLPD